MKNTGNFLDYVLFCSFVSFFEIICCLMRNRRRIADFVDEKKKPKIGETSSAFQTLPKSYSMSTSRFLDDSESSLQKHIQTINTAVENLINKFNESVEAWKKKFEELNGQANILANNRTQHRMKVDKFRSILYGYIPGVDSSDSDVSG